MIGVFSVAAATAVIGYDLAKDTVWQASAKRRKLDAMALTGSAAAGDTKVNVYVDQVRVAELYNTDVGFPNRDDYQPLGGAYIPPGSQIHVIVEDAPATNPLNGYLVITDI